jgi:ABC-type bacteriocin/lantibiotic exporter with double-glycine peptidase domain
MTLSERSAIDIIAILGTFIAVAFRIVPSANKIVSSLNTFRYSKAAIDSLYYLFRENFDSYKEKKNINVKKSFSLKNLYFKYLSKENYIFQNINFEIRNGDHICIYGDSGIGKSSLIDIILGLKEPVKGDIFIDDKKVDIEKYSWSSSMSFVPQDIYLLDQSIVENIALGVDKKFIDYNLIYKSLKISKLDEFVDLLPNKLNTITGEKGIQLSGGQKQRLGIARAIYRDSKILILDEATNALDSQLEEDLIKSLLLEYKEKTVIMITHKLNIISYFSRKIKIQDMVLIEKK